MREGAGLPALAGRGLAQAATTPHRVVGVMGELALSANGIVDDAGGA
jgi:hypothetical protein